MERELQTKTSVENGNGVVFGVCNRMSEVPFFLEVVSVTVRSNDYLKWVREISQKIESTDRFEFCH